MPLRCALAKQRPRLGSLQTRLRLRRQTLFGVRDVSPGEHVVPAPAVVAEERHVEIDDPDDDRDGIVERHESRFPERAQQAGHERGRRLGGVSDRAEVEDALA